LSVDAKTTMQELPDTLIIKHSNTASRDSLAALVLST
jgi:hypothetical protein